MGKGPVNTIQCGKVKIDVWENVGEKYTTVSFAISKNYKTNTGGHDGMGEWKTTNSYTLQELSDVQIAVTQVQLMYRVKGNIEQVKADEPAY